MSQNYIVAFIGLIGIIAAAYIAKLPVEVSIAFFAGIGTLLILIKTGIISHLENGKVENPKQDKKAFDRYILINKTYNTDWKSVFVLAQKTGVPCGVSLDDAKKAKKVTIIGGTAGIKTFEANNLKRAGCKIERLGGRNAQETAAIIKRRADNGGYFKEDE